MQGVPMESTGTQGHSFDSEFNSAPVQQRLNNFPGSRGSCTGGPNGGGGGGGGSFGNSNVGTIDVSFGVFAFWIVPPSEGVPGLFAYDQVNISIPGYLLGPTGPNAHEEAIY
jgi:hypothetical protein